MPIRGMTVTELRRSRRSQIDPNQPVEHLQSRRSTIDLTGSCDE
jgi:hypothetical protein